MEITEKEIKSTILDLGKAFDGELTEKTKEQLEDYWHFKWKETDSLEQNLYHFYDMLELYSHFCREWETAKNGSIRIVSRLRDKYQMPKIKEFMEQLTFEVKWKRM